MTDTTATTSVDALVIGAGFSGLAILHHLREAGLDTKVVEATDGIGGTWCERNLVFNANLMQAGANTLELTIPAGALTSGIIYDYLRLELDENAPPPEKPFATE